MVNDSMINAVENAKVTPIYECIEEPKPAFDIELGTPGVYNYDNVIEEQVNLKEVITLNLFKTITSMNNKLVNGRIKDKEVEKIRVDYLKTYINACNCFINLVNKGNVNVIYDKNVLKDFINLEDAIFNED
jgi:hypothetical protein